MPGPGFAATCATPGACLAGLDLDRVWLRRGVYFTTVATTLVLLLLLPLLRSAEGGACTTGWCWLSPAIRSLQVLLPSALEPWAVWFAANPGLFPLLGGTTALLPWCGGYLQRRIFDRMRAVW